MQKINYSNLIFIFLITMFAHTSINQPIQKQVMYPTQISNVAITTSGRLDKPKALVQFANEMQNASQENSKIPHKDNSIFRIMTYNVHFWRNPENTADAMAKMIGIIQNLNPDVVILQEVAPSAGFGTGTKFSPSQAKNLLESINFKYFSACNTVSGKWFGNVIAAKTQFNNIGRASFTTQTQPNEVRCFVYAQTTILNNKELYMYGTHLEVKGADTVRQQQIWEISQSIMQNLPNENVLIAADFNATRQSGTVQLLQNNGFKDCFAYLGWQHPTYTNWTGKEIDFIFLSPRWNLPLAGCYVYYDATSDHLPIIMDIQLTPIQQKPQGWIYDYSLQNDLMRLQRQLTSLQHALQTIP